MMKKIIVVSLSFLFLFFGVFLFYEFMYKKTVENDFYEFFEEDTHSEKECEYISEQDQEVVPLPESSGVLVGAVADNICICDDTEILYNDEFVESADLLESCLESDKASGLDKESVDVVLENDLSEEKKVDQVLVDNMHEITVQRIEKNKCVDSKDGQNQEVKDELQIEVSKNTDDEKSIEIARDLHTKSAFDLDAQCDVSGQITTICEEHNRSVLFLGRRYNHALVEDCEKRRWVVSAIFHHSLEFNALNNCGQEVPLSCLLFGKFKIQDIFLLSKLSYEDKLYRLDLELNPELSRAFLNSRVDQYLAYLSQFCVDIEAERRRKRVDFGAIYRFGVGDCDRFVCSLGFNIPVISGTHIMNLHLVGTDLRHHGFTDEDINFVLEDFHKYFVDVRDFFNRAILGTKGLCFRERQHKVGVGDISLFALFDLNQLSDRVDGFQIGFDLLLPSGNKRKSCNVWEVLLGNGGAFQLGFSADALFKTERNYLNPSLGFCTNVSFKFSSCRRVPKLKENSAEGQVSVDDVKDLIVPVFNSHNVRKFAAYDSCVAEFADQAVQTKTKLGSAVFFSVGNYFYHVFREDFRLALFYDFFYKGRDKVSVCTKGIYNTCVLEKCTDMLAHQISWHLAYVSKAGIEVNAGSRHVLGGKNHPKTHAIFASIIANF
ncbi:hypothetical protein ACFLYA_02605 [Candidatus Dependentiae bacterium]